MTGKKVEYHSIPYKNITHFSIETAGHFDLDAELKIWISGNALPLQKQFNKSLNGGVMKKLKLFVFPVIFFILIGCSKSSKDNSDENDSAYIECTGNVFYDDVTDVQENDSTIEFTDENGNTQTVSSSDCTVYY